MKLISMTDFVLEQSKYKEFRYQQIVDYANFLNQPLELRMFVPCDENNNVLEEPVNYTAFTNELSRDEFNYSFIDCVNYRQAKERVLFEGFKYDLQMEYWHDGSISFDEEYIENKTIEDIVKYNLQLTPTALKQLWI